MDISYIIEFLKELKKNNNREWFADNKEIYEKAKIQFELLTSGVIETISKFEPEVKGILPSQCTYRIYRDVRFSSDKSPYKTHMGAYVNAHGKKSNHCGYYLHLEPGNCMLCAGSICWPSRLLKELRQDIVDNIDEYIGIVENPEFKKYYPVIGEERLVTAPKGFDKNWEYIDYIKPKDFSICCNLPDTFFTEDKDTLLDRIGRIFEIAKPFADFTNFTIDEFER